MHDWRRVEPNIYRDFHMLWLGTVRHALNRGVLPKPYYALMEQSTANIQADVLALQGPRPADPDPAAEPAELGTRVPAVGLVERVARPKARPATRLAIRHNTGHRVVAVIELVSPGNKANARDFKAFVGKAAGVVAAGVHLLVIDPFAPTPRDPAGLHPAIWRSFARPRPGRPAYVPPAGKPLAVLSYTADRHTAVATVDAFAVGDPVPAGPLFLGDPGYVTVPLEAAYAAAWAEVPDVWQAVLAAP